ncbi:type IV secretory system conjugative DNA transfer family protein [Clostridium sp. CX1]|uniref:type IV secretory system conjugative DNA transfer family protein n=1 Tax=Clostridium sp. CX1 TaxID=2978346 RepID=UPI0021C187A7|nr:type IV secretory system conjugative DNA transfer family protein [Clostridium sp. CX1]MCT8975476.1 type IV secretory system conjugative DNA transfer family protein [Clostridium sp. CX1]
MLGSTLFYGKVIGALGVGATFLNVYLDNHSIITKKPVVGKSNKLKDIKGADGIRISKNMQLSEKKCFENILVVGATGSRKTTSLFYPNLLSDCIKGSIIILDAKGELYRDTANYQRSIGREPILFSPLDHMHSWKYNPLEQAKDLTEVRELSQTLLINGVKAIELSSGKSGGNDSTWINMALPLLVASMLYCKGKGRPMNTITEALRLIINHSTEEIDLLFSNCKEDIKEQYNIFKTSLESPKTASSIKVTLATNLQIFLDKNIEKLTSETEFTPEELREKPIALYVSYNDQKANYLSPFLSIFYSQMITHLIENYSEESLPVYFMFDEFATATGQILNFHNTVAVSRSRELSFLVCLQSISQLFQLYGRDNGLTILNNLKTKCILPSISETSTLSYASELCGYVDVKKKSTSRSGNNTSISYSATKEKMFAESNIRELKINEMLIIAHNLAPVKDYLNIYYENESYSTYVYPEEFPERF